MLVGKHRRDARLDTRAIDSLGQKTPAAERANHDAGDKPNPDGSECLLARRWGARLHRVLVVSGHAGRRCLHTGRRGHAEQLQAVADHLCGTGNQRQPGISQPRVLDQKHMRVVVGVKIRRHFA